MATDQFSPATAAKPTPSVSQAPPSGQGSQVHTHHSSSPPRSSGSSHPSPSTKPATASRSTGFVRTPATPLPTFSAQHEPESSNMGRYVTIGTIAVLVILLIFQVISKSRLRSQVETLEAQNTALSQQVALTPTVTPPALTNLEGAQAGSLQLITYPILYREKQYQKIAQTISVTTDTKIAGISLRGTPGEGSAGQVAIYEAVTPSQINTRKDLVKQSFDTSKLTLDPSFFVEFKRAVELKAGVGYTVVVETTNRNTVANIAYRLATSTAPGTMWVYSRKLSDTGEVLSQDFTWQEISGYDLFFELRGAE